MRTDVVEREQVDALVQTALGEFGQVDGLVNLAYFHKGPSPVAELSVDDLTRELHVDVVGCLIAMQAVYPHLRGRGGSIVNFSSGAGVEGLAERAAYSAAKAAVRLLSRTAALEWGREDIRVNTVCPFAMSESLAAAVAAGTVDQAHLDAVSPLGRPGDPERDIGAGVAFLLSDDARYVTGQTIVARRRWARALTRALPQALYDAWASWSCGHSRPRVLSRSMTLGRTSCT